jgi:hypothetical protein
MEREATTEMLLPAGIGCEYLGLPKVLNINWPEVTVSNCTVAPKLMVSPGPICVKWRK